MADDFLLKANQVFQDIYREKMLESDRDHQVEKMKTEIAALKEKGEKFYSDIRDIDHLKLSIKEFDKKSKWKFVELGKLDPDWNEKRMMTEKQKKRMPDNTFAYIKFEHIDEYGNSYMFRMQFVPPHKLLSIHWAAEEELNRIIHFGHQQFFDNGVHQNFLRI